LKDDSDDGCDDDVTSGGRLFHVFATVTGKARSRMVRRWVGGTTSAKVDDERRRCRPESSATGSTVRLLCGIGRQIDKKLSRAIYMHVN